MASRISMQPLNVIGPGIKLLGFRFFPQGASVTPMTVANGLLVGPGVASVTRQGTAGTYLVTLEDSYLTLIYANAFAQMAVATDLNGELGPITGFGTSVPPTLIIRMLTGAVPTDIAADPANSVFVQLTFKDVSV